mmetsp:Transcript_27627/g.88861  ORF Transcript_27627/g.88861 Transcript_27627/m.88861 type:complete len:226 (+) Transcript_27627:373-1050(+)
MPSPVRMISGSYAWLVRHTASSMGMPCSLAASRPSPAPNTAVYPARVSSASSAPSRALPMPWLMPSVFCVPFHSAIASGSVAARSMTYRSRSTHGKPSSVSSLLSRPASWVVMPWEERPASAPYRPAKANVACEWRPSSGGWNTVTSLFRLMPESASQSKLRPENSCPPSVRDPQAPHSEQCLSNSRAVRLANSATRPARVGADATVQRPGMKASTSSQNWFSMR